MKFSAFFSPSNVRLWLLVLLTGLAALASYWALQIILSDNPTGPVAVRTRPDYWVENFNFIKMLPTGQNDYRVTGKRLEHFPSDDHAEVTLPVMTNLDPLRLPVSSRSERGIIKNLANQADTEVHLYEKVVVDRPKTERANQLRLETEYLLAFPDQHRMETTLPVKILAGDTLTTGVGMKANNETQYLEVLSKVVSIIPPRALPTKK